MPFPERYLELVWLSSRADAEANPLRLDRRADWRTTGACPFGIGLRGELTDRDAFWPYQLPDAPGVTIWIHRLDEAQPLVFVFEAGPEQVQRLRARITAMNPGAIRELRMQLPVAAPAVLDRVTPRLVSRPGPPRMELVVGGAPLEITPELALV